MGLKHSERSFILQFHAPALATPPGNDLSKLIILRHKEKKLTHVSVAKNDNVIYLLMKTSLEPWFAPL